MIPASADSCYSMDHELITRMSSRGPPRRGIRVHGPRLEYLCYEQVVYDESWRDTIDGLATVLFASRGVHEHGHGR